MADNNKSKHGGKRIGAGRPKQPNSKVQVALKLDHDLNEVFNSPLFQELKMVRGQYINTSIRERMVKDGLISSDESQE